MIQPTTTAAVLFTGLLVAASISAAPLEINQEVVEQGLAPCDTTPGFPCQIVASGSYRLSSDLVSTDPDVHIIEITADDVTLDLGGFSLRGPASCAWDGAVHCIHTGVGDGVHASNADRVAVHDGHVLGAASGGLVLGESAAVERVHVSSVGDVGIVVETGSTVNRCCVGFVGSFGIEGAFGTSVHGSTVQNAGDVGISDVSVAEGNRVISNDGHGIETTLSAVIRNNVVRDNHGDGVYAAIDALVLGNILFENSFYGLRFATFEGAYGGNTIANNTIGTVGGPGVEVATNSCDGSTTCP